MNHVDPLMYPSLGLGFVDVSNFFILRNHLILAINPSNPTVTIQELEFLILKFHLCK